MDNASFCNKCGFFGQAVGGGHHNRPSDGGACNYVAHPAKPSTPSNEELTQRMEIAPEVVDDMIALMREMVGPPIAHGNTVGKAANILKRIDLPKPVDPIDPDEQEARDIVRYAYPDMKPEYAGRRYQIALAAIKRGRTLAAEGTAHE